jgi:adenosylcobyric acid synthase
VRRTHTRFGALAGPWAPLSGVAVSGYEIHLGETAQHPAMAANGDVAQAVLPGGLGWSNPGSNVLGVYLHGLFEDPAVLQALFGGDVPTLENALKGLALTVETCFDSPMLMGWVG